MKKEILDKMIMIHTLRIDLMDGTFLSYNIDAYEKEDLEKYLEYRTDFSHDSETTFIQVLTIEERVVFIRIKAIKRLIFCSDPPARIKEVKYHDNFQVITSDENEIIIPDIIIKFKDSSEPLCYSDLDPETDYILLDEEAFSNKPFRKTGFISINDEDGEQNYIPVVNITCMEFKRELIFSDEIWKSMEHSKDIDKRKN
ncbi:MAG: hypothetical protein NTX61_03650 [Bacteroidetes bacterium]|nr:hypothetical protein [Bacteroidota bacterium]